MHSATRRHTLGDLLRRTAARLPNKPAILCGSTAWTYREFDAVVNRLANGLAQGRAGAPVAAGDKVAVLSRNSHAFAALRFALARLGAVDASYLELARRRGAPLATLDAQLHKASLKLGRPQQ